MRREVLGYQASTVRKLLMEAAGTQEARREGRALINWGCETLINREAEQ